ncbi:MAG: addiction module antidote protein, HigA family [Oxalobacter sp.]|nr:MAG: addiction module antidote protein, HigA family [Oxalobacter sp.]
MLPKHPGKTLQADFLQALNLSQYALAKAIGVPPRRINQIVKGERAITPDTALRLGAYFKVSEFYWMELQNQYDAGLERKALAKVLSAIQPYGSPQTKSKL